jgi:hypothetical protein
MTKDFKYGIIFGLPILIIGVVYFVLNAPKDTPATQPATQPAMNEPIVSPANDPIASADAPTEPSDTPVPVVPPVVPDAPAVAPPPSPVVATTDETPGEVDWTADNYDPSTPASPPAQPIDDAGDSAPVPIRFDENTPAQPAPSEDRWALGSPASEAAAPVSPPAQPDRQDDPPVISAVETPALVAVGAGRKYVVQRGDLGYWYIAEKVYGAGNGKYWKRISDANQQADSTALRPGQVLTIPPLPARETTALVAPEDYGRTTTTPGGQKVYTVSKDDTAGLWGISKKVWGKGHLWEAIQKANPQIDPSKLRPGMKIVIPPQPRGTSAGGSTTATGVTRTTAPANQHGQVITENGKRYYIVAAGDRGYWGIAAKDSVYGAGKYSYLIHQANRGVNSDNLQPGDKLLIPPKPAGSERAPAAGRQPRRRIEPVPEDVPDFGG